MLEFQAKNNAANTLFGSKIRFRIQLTASSRRENGGAYGGDVFGGKWVVSRGDLSNYLFCVVVWSVLVNDEFLVQLEKSTPPPLFPRRQSARY